MPLSKEQLFLICSLFICINSIYSVPDLSNTTNKFNTFTIDFKGIETPPATFWSLANFHLDTTYFEKTHSDVSGGGAYAGLQTLSDGSRVGIISFWKIAYKEDDETRYVYAHRIYPPGEEMNFSGEGEGSTFRGTYDWDANVWYRFVLHTWEDTSKHTLVGIWIQNTSTREWTLFSYFDSNLENSYIGGGWGALAMFQEVFNKQYANKERKFNLKNMYVYDRTDKKWVSINTSALSYDKNAEGTLEIGFTSNHFYGYSGPKVEGAPINNNVKGSITQPSSPETEGIQIKHVTISLTRKKMVITWVQYPESDPIYRNHITIESRTLLGYKTIHTKIMTRPEVSSYTYIGNFKGTYRVSLNQTSIFGDSRVEQSVTMV